MVDRRKVSVYKLASDYKARGMDNRRAWGQFVIDRDLKPEMDAGEFYRYYDVAEPKILKEDVDEKPAPKDDYRDPEFADFGRRVRVVSKIGSRIVGDMEGTIYRTLRGSSGEPVYEVDFGDGPVRISGRSEVIFLNPDSGVYSDRYLVSVRDKTIRKLSPEELDDLGRIVSSQRYVIRASDPGFGRLLRDGYRVVNPQASDFELESPPYSDGSYYVRTAEGKFVPVRVRYTGEAYDQYPVYELTYPDGTVKRTYSLVLYRRVARTMKSGLDAGKRYDIQYFLSRSWEKIQSVKGAALTRKYREALDQWGGQYQVRAVDPDTGETVMGPDGGRMTNPQGRGFGRLLREGYSAVNPNPGGPVRFRAKVRFRYGVGATASRGMLVEPGSEWEALSYTPYARFVGDKIERYWKLAEILPGGRLGRRQIDIPVDQIGQLFEEVGGETNGRAVIGPGPAGTEGNPGRGFSGEWVVGESARLGGVYKIGGRYYYAYHNGPYKIVGVPIGGDGLDGLDWSRTRVYDVAGSTVVDTGWSQFPISKSEYMKLIDERDAPKERKAPQPRGDQYKGFTIVRHKTNWGMKYFASRDPRVTDPDWAEENADFSGRDREYVKRMIDEYGPEINPQTGVYTINSGTLPILRRLATEYGQSKLVRVSPATTANEMYRQAEILESKGVAKDIEIFKVHGRTGTYGYAPAGLLDQALEIQEQEEEQGPDPKQLAKAERAAKVLESKIDAIRDKYGAKADKLIEDANRALDLYESGDSVKAALEAGKIERECPQERGIKAACKIFVRELTRAENPSRGMRRRNGSGRSTQFEKVRPDWYRAESTDGGMWVHVRKHGREWATFTNEDRHSVNRSDIRNTGYDSLDEALAEATRLLGGQRNPDQNDPSVIGHYLISKRGAVYHGSPDSASDKYKLPDGRWVTLSRDGWEVSEGAGMEAKSGYGLSGLNDWLVNEPARMAARVRAERELEEKSKQEAKSKRTSARIQAFIDEIKDGMERAGHEVEITGPSPGDLKREVKIRGGSAWVRVDLDTGEYFAKELGPGKSPAKLFKYLSKYGDWEG